MMGFFFFFNVNTHAFPFIYFIWRGYCFKLCVFFIFRNGPENDKIFYRFENVDLKSIILCIFHLPFYIFFFLNFKAIYVGKVKQAFQIYGFNK